MSNIYINEPPTSGKVLLETSAGDIDVELWSKETPKACRNFIQLCMEGYYDGLIFHRVVKDFIVQGGDPTGTGEGGESIYGKPFKDEFHSRLKFNRRGLVAMANAGAHDNGSQFFFTMAPAPELQNKHTIFGKVAGNTVYNMIKLQESEVDGNERPFHPYRIIKTQVLSNPFDDIIPRVLKKKKDKTEAVKPKSQSKATKNFNLLSFGEEAEEDEEENVQVTKDMRIKSKSSHDLTDDPRLSSKPAVEIKSDDKNDKVMKKVESGDDSNSSDTQPEDKKHNLTSVKKKKEKSDIEPITKSRSELLKEESKKLRKELKRGYKDNDETEEVIKNPALEEYKKEQEKYEKTRRTIGKKGGNREDMTLLMLSKFKDKLESVKTIGENHYISHCRMRHKLQFDEKRNKVLDANVHDSDRYEIYDPRNPMTQRRREASKQKHKDKD
ncbi:hypothetical protein LOTGIDRAFT_194800 [Lottia gigantea]|uniref:Spliceosome-associated protein CWC27 homolog n=1 Tax=Lottia gigantea TaxID=225164 RepID=V4A067_LOTGI|nr:hypothetical protein LOTGIDRAFT_194800 [Lottia gigantea]ESO86646.1 hypothetical protein LOTGIDRAFT_194800 [Lottia gigantea]